MKKITTGLFWCIDGHTLTVASVNNSECQITETWFAEDTGEYCKNTETYIIETDDDNEYAYPADLPDYRLYAGGAFNYTEPKEEIDMRNTFEFNGRTFNRQDNGYCFVTENGKKTRISGAKFNDAYDEFLAWQMEQTEQNMEDEAIAETTEELKTETTEEPKQKKTKKRNRKDLVNTTLEDGTVIGLTEKQLLFIERMPEDDFWENGLDSALWVDCYCETLRDELNAMQVGAMVSTLREKGIIIVNADKRNGKKNAYFHLTDLGQRLAIALGLK